MKIALVHDYLTQFGGAEQVLSVLAGVYPDAPILTSIHDPHLTLPGIVAGRIRQSSLGRIAPFRRNHRIATPLYPLAMRELARGIRDADVILADSSAWSHQVGKHQNQKLIVYCHSPARFLYGDPDYLGPTRISGTRARLFSAGLAPYRWLDRRAWRSADLVLANSSVVANRLRDRVGISATVLYPPVDTEFFRPASETTREDYLLVVSRLVAHKAIDLVVRTATSAGLRLKVIGEGRDRPRLEAMAGPTVEFLGFQSRTVVREHLQRSRAFVLPGAEDFGITAVEAQAAGTPVIALGRGGATESVLDGRTGVLFAEQTESALLSALDRLEGLAIRSEACIANAARFSQQQFVEGIRNAVAQVTGSTARTGVDDTTT